MECDEGAGGMGGGLQGVNGKKMKQKQRRHL